MKRALGILLATSTLAACGPNHIAPFTARERTYKSGEYAATQQQNRPATGSIYTEAQSGFLEDTRALRVGDVVLVKGSNSVGLARVVAHFAAREG